MKRLAPTQTAGKRKRGGATNGRRPQNNGGRARHALATMTVAQHSTCTSRARALSRHGVGKRS
eukprot:15453048-Alexandrium_andersonii.AAC.1